MGTIGGEIFNPEKIKKEHSNFLESMDLPSWIPETVCFHCGQKLGILSIKSVSLCLNASRLGDIAVEVACESCSQGYDFYYRYACKNLDDFCSILKAKEAPSEPESQMTLDAIDNNLLEKLIKERQKDLPLQKKKDNVCL